MYNIQKASAISQAYSSEIRDLADEFKMVNARTTKLEDVLEKLSYGVIQGHRVVENGRIQKIN